MTNLQLMQLWPDLEGKRVRLKRVDGEQWWRGVFTIEQVVFIDRGESAEWKAYISTDDMCQWIVCREFEVEEVTSPFHGGMNDENK